MLNNWRITKYNPAFRNEKGTYLREEWTSVSDIVAGMVSIRDYRRVEEAYIQSLAEIMNDSKVNALQIFELEKNGPLDVMDALKPLYSKEHQRIYNDVTSGSFVMGENLNFVLELLLRENLWCKLMYSDKMYAHFGFDYYMYVGSHRECTRAINTIKSMDLFVENYCSPYCDTE